MKVDLEGQYKKNFPYMAFERISYKSLPVFG